MAPGPTSNRSSGSRPSGSRAGGTPANSSRSSGTRSSGERSSGGHGRSLGSGAGQRGPNEAPRGPAGDSPTGDGSGCGAEPSRRRSQEIVAGATRYFEAHYGEPIAPTDVARHLGISESCLASSFDECRRRTPFQALESFRLAQLFQRVREHPTDSLATQVRQCGLPALARTDRLFEANFGIGLAPFRHTSRRAAEDRAFRVEHPGPEDLVVPPDGGRLGGDQATPLARNQASSRCQPSAASRARKVGR